MHERSVLGVVDVDDATLAARVADRLGVPEVELVDTVAEVATYDMEALTTAGRFLVHGTARHAGGVEPFAFYVKHVQCWSRSPIFEYVPVEMREAAIAGIPWEREPKVYESDLGDRLPDGLSMPRAFAVDRLDEKSAALWLELVDVDPVRWGVDRFAQAAHLLGRLAASPRVAPVGEIGAVPDVPRQYYVGRFEGQVLPALHDDTVWQHPLMTATYDERLRGDMRAAGDGMLGRLDELDAVPVLTQHGDACSRNLLVRRGHDGFVLIDYGFWGRGPVGFDLTQLLVGEVQTGERPAEELPALEAACLPAYVDGLRAEGVEVDLDVVRRAHALLLLLFAGLSSFPLELLEGPPTEDGLRVARAKAGLARFALDLAEATARI